jgi:hypothetical protein
MTSLHAVLESLGSAGVRHVLVGVTGANHWARDGSLVATYGWHELVIDPCRRALATAWHTLQSSGFTLRAGTTRILDPVPDEFAAHIAAELRTTTAYRQRDRMLLDLHTAIPGFTFEELWLEHRAFQAGDITIHVARLRHILESLAERGARWDPLAVATWSQGLHDHFVPDPGMAGILAEHRARHGIEVGGEVGGAVDPHRSDQPAR